MQFSAAVKAAVMLLVGVSSAAQAQLINQDFVYQGELVDNGSLANGFYDFRIRLYDDRTGGNQIGDEFRANGYEVIDGYVELPVSFGNSTVLYTGELRWMEIEVNPSGTTNAVILGRQQLQATPYASFATNAEFALNAATSLDESYDFGRTINADLGPVRVINSAQVDDALLELGALNSSPGAVHVIDEQGDLRAAMRTDSSGGLLAIYEQDKSMIELGSDSSAGGGGSLLMARRSAGAAELGVVLQGNFAGTEKPNFLMTGGGGDPSVSFAINETGDNSVRLPADAINSVEILDEVGFANSVDTISSTLSQVGGGVVTVLDSVTITPPTAGFVLVLASSEVSINHGTGLTSASFGVSDMADSLALGQRRELQIPAGAPAGLYEYPLAWHGVYPATPGTAQTFYLHGSWNGGSGSASADDVVLSAIFIPTTYGTVTSSNRSGAPDVPGQFEPVRHGGKSHHEILLERQQSIAANAARLAREVELMNQQYAELQRQLQQEADSAVRP